MPLININADDIAIDWISNKLYWTNNGPFTGIGVLDLSAGYHKSLINTGQDNSPKAIVVDPLTRLRQTHIKQGY